PWAPPAVKYAQAANECDIKVFSCPKLGNSLEEYEDAWAHRQTRTPVGIRVAVADGATESSFAKLWAVLLAESYVRSEVTGAEFSAKSTDRKSTRLNSSHVKISYAVFCLKKKIKDLNIGVLSATDNAGL